MSEGRQVLLVLSVVAAGMILLAATVWGWIAVARQLAFEVRSPAPNVAADQKGSVPDPPSRPKPAGFRRRETLEERQADFRRALDERTTDGQVVDRQGVAQLQQFR
ncbi:MAG TPA: hypothetical protein VM510_10840, partial [Caulifigura sp.]|nr:hypothetical protein [Caulifigura sp.]